MIVDISEKELDYIKKHIKGSNDYMKYLKQKHNDDVEAIYPQEWEVYNFLKGKGE